MKNSKRRVRINTTLDPLAAFRLKSFKLRSKSTHSKTLDKIIHFYGAVVSIMTDPKAQNKKVKELQGLIDKENYYFVKVYGKEFE